MSQAATGRKATAETRRRMSQAQRGKRLPDAAKQRLREINTGKKQLPETVEKRAAKLRGRKQPPRSAELNARLADALKAFQIENGHPFKGKKHSDESKAKMRASRLAFLQRQRGKDDAP